MSVARIYGARTASRAYRDHARQRRRAILRGGLKWALYAAAACLLCVIEGTSFAYRGASVTASPCLLPAWVCAVAMYEGYIGGAWFGIGVGLLSSAAGGDPVYVLPPVFMAYGLAVGLLGTRFLKKGFFIYAGYETAVCAVHGLLLLAIALICAMASGTPVSAVWPLLWDGAISDFVPSVLLSLLLYLPLAVIRRITAERNDPTDSIRLRA